MKSDALIQALVADLKPVRRLAPLKTRALKWACFAVICVVAATWAAGLRADWGRALGRASFMVEATALLSVFVLAGYRAFQLSVPGVVDDRRSSLSLVAVGAWLALVAARLVQGAAEGVLVSGLSCVWRMLWLSLLPGLALAWMLRKAAPFDRARVTEMAALSALALGVLGTQLICAKDGALHVLLWHALPLLVATCLGSSLARAWPRPRS